MRGSPYTNLNRPPLREAALRRSLTGPGRFFTEILVVPETGSTNVDVAAAAQHGAGEGYVLVAERQTAGKGRVGRTWTAPVRAGLTFSVLLRPAVPVARLGWVPLLAGVALAEAVGRVAVVDAALKWPNDLLVRSATGAGGYGKCGGVLAEMVSVPGDWRGVDSATFRIDRLKRQAIGARGDSPEDPAAVLGIGLNVSQRADELPAPPDGTAHPATSLAVAGAVCADRDPLLRAVLRSLAEWYGRWRDADGDPVASGVRAAYVEACATLGREVRVTLPDGAVIAGTASEVDVDGRLVIDLGRGETHRVAAGDVRHVRSPGRADPDPGR